MAGYGQYCPVAQALEIVGDRWTLLIIRDMLTGTQHFNDLLRGLPGLSRGLLAKRLRQLEAAGVVEKRTMAAGRRTTAYHLTEAGRALEGVIDALLVWGSEWAFGEPTPEQLDPLLLMWWLRSGVRPDALPAGRVTVQFSFTGNERAPSQRATYWLVLAREDVTVCLTDPGHPLDLLVTADLAAFFQVWVGRLAYDEALRGGAVRVEGLPRLVRAFPQWFALSPAAPAVRAAGGAAQSAAG